MSVKIIDLYSGNDFNPGQIVMDGYKGVVFKGGQGAWGDVPRVHPDWWQKAADFGLLRGWYWLCDSRYAAPDHIVEMDKYKLLDDVGELGLWADLEKPVLSMTETDYYRTPYAGSKNVVDFFYLLNLRGVKAGAYTGPGAYELIMRYAPVSAHEYLAQFDLWTAQYPYAYQEGISKPTLYGKWTDWVWWQWREGPDVNVFNGTDEEFHNKYGSVIIPPPTGETPMYTGTVLVTELNIRPQANTSQPKIGTLKYNDKIEASAKENGWWKLTKITRAGLNVPLPASECYAYEGATGGYIRTDTFTQPPPIPSEFPSEVGLTIGGVTKQYIPKP